MSNKRRVVLPLVGAGLVCVAAVGFASAYLTDSETTRNTFTVGKVTTDLIEPHYPGNGSAEVTNLVPNSEVQKDPQVENTGNNNMVAFLKVYSPVSLINVVDDSGLNATGLHLDEIFWLKDSTQELAEHENGFDLADKWVRLEDKETTDSKPYYHAVVDDEGVTRYEAVDETEATAIINSARFFRKDAATNEYIPIDHATAKAAKDGNTYTVYVKDGNDYAEVTDVQKAIDEAQIYKAYVFGHEDEVVPHDTTDAIFDKVQLKNVIEGEIDTQTQSIVIENYAIQSANIISSGAVIEPVGMDADTLGSIYDIFLNQATAGQGDQAVEGDWQQNVEAHDANVTLNKDLDGNENPITKTRLDLSYEDTKLKIGDTAAATSVVTVNNKVVTDKTVSYEVCDKDGDTANANGAIEVAADGTVTAKALGTSYVKATIDGMDTPVIIEFTVVNVVE